jgi:hypothetical protein
VKLFLYASTLPFLFLGLGESESVGVEAINDPL